MSTPIETLAEQLVERPAPVFPQCVERTRSTDVLQAAADLCVRRGKLTRWALIKIHLKKLRGSRWTTPGRAA
jgi:hypothetical protein